MDPPGRRHPARQPGLNRPEAYSAGVTCKWSQLTGFCQWRQGGRSLSFLHRGPAMVAPMPRAGPGSRPLSAAEGSYLA